VVSPFAGIIIPQRKGRDKGEKEGKFQNVKIFTFFHEDDIQTIYGNEKI
jgi:hypothetical protein